MWGVDQCAILVLYCELPIGRSRAYCRETAVGLVPEPGGVMRQTKRE